MKKCKTWSDCWTKRWRSGSAIRRLDERCPTSLTHALRGSVQSGFIAPNKHHRYGLSVGISGTHRNSYGPKNGGCWFQMVPEILGKFPISGKARYLSQFNIVQCSALFTLSLRQRWKSFVMGWMCHLKSKEKIIPNNFTLPFAECSTRRRSNHHQQLNRSFGMLSEFL